MSSNIGNYRNDADFITEVFPNVYWVPICSLGKSRYSNDEMSEQIVKLTPQGKYEKIKNLYEEIQISHSGNLKRHKQT